MAKLRKDLITPRVGDGGGQEVVSHAAGSVNGYTLYGGQFSSICQNGTACDLVIPPLGIYPTKGSPTCEMEGVPITANIYRTPTTCQA